MQQCGFFLLNWIFSVLDCASGSAVTKLRRLEFPKIRNVLHTVEASKPIAGCDSADAILC
jgi:hypothetical protein